MTKSTPKEQTPQRIHGHHPNTYESIRSTVAYEQAVIVRASEAAALIKDSNLLARGSYQDGEFIVDQIVADRYSVQEMLAAPSQSTPQRTDYNEPLELAKQRVAIVERVMKLPYIKAQRDTSKGQERFVARDDLIKAIHDYALAAPSQPQDEIIEIDEDGNIVRGADLAKKLRAPSQSKEETG